MKCAQCQAENDAGARFCEDCGARLEAACPSCGAPVTSGKKFCRSCGAALTPEPASRFASLESYTPKHLAEKILTSKAALEGERKQVTVLFADLKGSMELLADRDPEEARKILDPVLERMMEAVHRYEGTVNQVMGDGIMALFGAPLAHEDHAVRACYAALRMQDTVKRYAESVRRSEGLPLQIRIGLNSGEVVVRSIGSDLHMDYTAIGQTTHVAARMEQMALPGSVLLSGATLALAEGYVEVRSLGPLPVKGLAAPLEVYELTRAATVRSRFQAATARGLTRFVGRESELDQLRQALERAGTGHGQVVAVVGEPGVGKSRLYWEFTHSHRTQGWLILKSVSVSYGTATNYLPIIELLRVYFEIENADDHRKIREKVTGKLFSLDRQLEPSVSPMLWLLDAPVEDEHWKRLDPPQRRQRILDGVKRLLLRESQVKPLMVLFEDLHWILHPLRGPATHETGWGRVRGARRHQGRRRIGASSPYWIRTRSPASTLNCCARWTFYWGARFLIFELWRAPRRRDIVATEVRHAGVLSPVRGLGHPSAEHRRVCAAADRRAGDPAHADLRDDHAGAAAARRLVDGAGRHARRHGVHRCVLAPDLARAGGERRADSGQPPACAPGTGAQDRRE
jgi:class 3 adenylate cyclase